MKIEEAIKQSRFTDNYQKAVVNLVYTANWLREEQTKLLKQYDILPQHFNVMRIIKGRYPKPVSPGEIKEVMIDKANDLTRLLDKLEKKGWIKRQLCPSNRRRMDITLTEKGIKMLQAANRSLQTFTEELKTHFSDKEAASLTKLLDKMRE